MANESTTKPTYSELEAKCPYCRESQSAPSDGCACWCHQSDPRVLRYIREQRDYFTDELSKRDKGLNTMRAELARVRGLLQRIIENLRQEPYTGKYGYLSEALRIAESAVEPPSQASCPRCNGTLVFPKKCTGCSQTFCDMDCLDWHVEKACGGAESADIGKLDTADKKESCNCVGGCGRDTNLGIPVGKCKRVIAEDEAIAKSGVEIGKVNRVPIIRVTQGGSTGCTQDAYDRIGKVTTEAELPNEDKMTTLGSAETGGEKAAPQMCEHEDAKIKWEPSFQCPDCGATIPIAPACTATVHTADCDKTGECDRLDDYVTGVKETPPNFRRRSQNQTVSGGVEGAHEGTTADKSGSREPEKLNTADKSGASPELLPTQLDPISKHPLTPEPQSTQLDTRSEKK